MKKISSIQYMRAISIFFIVLWHTIESAKIPWESGYHKIATIFFSDGTASFVIISGFFFGLFRYRYNIKNYFKGKIKNIIIPYLFITLISTFIFDGDLSFTSSHMLDALIKPINYPLWFIPFIVTMFLLTPLMIKINNKNLTIMTAPSILIIIITNRGDFSASNLDFFIGNIIHYTPCFIIGIWYSSNFQSVNTYVKNNHKLLFVLFLSLTIMIVAAEFNYFKYLKRSIYSFYKLPLTLAIIVFFESIKTKKIISITLDHIGNISFPIFFIHAIFLKLIFDTKMINDHLMSAQNNYKFIFSIIISIIIIFLCSVIASIAKRLLKEKSKFIIGY